MRQISTLERQSQFQYGLLLFNTTKSLHSKLLIKPLLSTRI